jgi:hypothetical protein
MWIRFALFNAALAAILTAQPRPALRALTVQPTALVLAVGERRTATISIESVNGTRERVRYVVQDTTIATVDTHGVLTARGRGDTRLTVVVAGDAPGFTSSEISAAVSVRVR